MWTNRAARSAARRDGRGFPVAILLPLLGDGLNTARLKRVSSFCSGRSLETGGQSSAGQNRLLTANFFDVLVIDFADLTKRGHEICVYEQLFPFWGQCVLETVCSARLVLGLVAAPSHSVHRTFRNAPMFRGERLHRPHSWRGAATAT